MASVSEMKSIHFFFLAVLVCCCCTLNRHSLVEAVIYSAPSENVTLPLTRTTPVEFQCTGQGVITTWVINGTEILEFSTYDDMHNDIEVIQNFNNNGSTTVKIIFEINLSVARNNTNLSCLVRQQGQGVNDTSQVIVLTIAGPPLKPVPQFHVVNATHIKVQWDKPFALPEFDVKNYTLSTFNTTSGEISSKTFNAVGLNDTDYPIVHYKSNEGVIPRDCIYLNFSLTATNDVGNSSEDFTIGGFAIAPSPISTDAIFSWVTFSADGLIPMLHINFTFPTVCDYHDANYSVVILNGNGAIVDGTGNVTYDKDGPEEVTIFLEDGMTRDTHYTAVISVTTAVNTERTEIQFSTRLNVNTPGPVGIRTSPLPEVNNTTTFIASGAVFGVLLILALLVIIITVVVFFSRRNHKDRVSRAHQREIETDEAVQRAAHAMVPNPIYSGSPIYEEIVDAKNLKSLTKGHVEGGWRDEGYVEISADAVEKMVSAFPIPEESKLVGDKYATIPEDTYTVMNPIGTLSSQLGSPTNTVAPTLPTTNIINTAGSASELNSNGVITSTTVFNGHCMASVPTETVVPTDEERYVIGAF